MAELKRQIEQYRSLGFMPMHEESYPGVTAVGAAIKDGERPAVGGSSLSFLGIPDTMLQLGHLARLIVDMAAVPSQKLRAWEGYGAVHPASARGSDPGAMRIARTWNAAALLQPRKEPSCAPRPF